MLIIGTALTDPVEMKDSHGRAYFSFLLREDPDEEIQRAVDFEEFGLDRSYSLFQVRAYIDQVSADLISQGMLSQVSGRIALLAEAARNGRSYAKHFIVTQDVRPAERKKPQLHQDVPSVGELA